MFGRRWKLAIYSIVALGMVGTLETTEMARAKTTKTHAVQVATARHDQTFRQVGMASWYGRAHQGHPTASGEPFDKDQLTAAHRSLPLESRATVTNLENGRSVEVTINDRGPYVKGRTIDLSAKAAELLGMRERGVALVRIEVPGRETGYAVD